MGASAPARAPMSERFILSSGIPVALAEQIKNLEDWAQANRRDARWDTLRFWMLKIPAILVSAGSGVFAYFQLNGIAVLAGAVASLCVLIDALNPGGALRNFHLRAFNDLRRLQESMVSNWQVGLLRGEEQKLLAAKIIESTKKEKDRIDAYITNAETSLAVTDRSRSHRSLT